MDISAVMDDLGTAVSTIDGLTPHPYEVDRVNPPAAIIGLPDTYEFDTTYARGSDRAVFPITVVVGRTDARTSRGRLAQYLAGNGAYSIKQFVEAFDATSYDSARVTSVDIGAVTIAGVTYLAATFDVEIVG